MATADFSFENHPYQSHYVAPHNPLNTYQYESYWVRILKVAIPYAALDFRTVALHRVSHTPFLLYPQVTLTTASIHLSTVHFDLRYQFPCLIPYLWLCHVYDFLFFYSCGYYGRLPDPHDVYEKKGIFYPGYFVIPPFSSPILIVIYMYHFPFDGFSSPIFIFAMYVHLQNNLPRGGLGRFSFVLFLVPFFYLVPLPFFFFPLARHAKYRFPHPLSLFLSWWIPGKFLCCDIRIMVGICFVFREDNCIFPSIVFPKWEVSFPVSISLSITCSFPY